MANNPPPYRILSPEEWIKFSQGEFTNLADIDRARKDNKTKAQEEILNFSTPEFKAKQELITTQLASGIASQPKENIIDWIKDTFGSGLQSITQSVQEFLLGISKPIIENIIAPPVRAYNDLVDGLNKAIVNNAQYQYVKGLVDGVVTRYNDKLEGLKHLDNQPAIIQQIGKITAAAIPVIITIAAAAAPVVAAEILFPPAVLGGAVYQGASAIKFLANLRFGNTLLKLDRDARGVTEEDLEKLPDWRKFAAFLREIAIFCLAGGVLSVSCELAQAQLRVLPKVNKEIAKYLEKVPEEVASRNKEAALKLRTLSDDVAARPMPEKIAQYVEKNLADREKRVLDLLGNTQESKKLLKLADDNVARIISETDLYVRINQKNLVRVINKEKFTNAFENLEEGYASGISKVNNPALQKMPKSRYMAEAKLFGIEESAKGSERPIYGYLSRGGQYISSKEGSVTPNYGDVAVKMKSSVKKRSTITPDDSTRIYTQTSGMSSSLLSSPKVTSFISNQYLRSSISGKPIEVANALTAVSRANNIDKLINITGKFWGRKLISREIVFTSEMIGDFAKELRAKGIEYGSDEYKKEMQKFLRQLEKSSELQRTSYIEFQAHGGLLAEDIEEIFMEELTHKDVQAKIKTVRDLRKGLEVKNKPPQDFIDMVDWADVMGVKISGKKVYKEIPVSVVKKPVPDPVDRMKSINEKLSEAEQKMSVIQEKIKSRVKTFDDPVASVTEKYGELGNKIKQLEKIDKQQADKLRVAITKSQGAVSEISPLRMRMNEVLRQDQGINNYIANLSGKIPADQLKRDVDYMRRLLDKQIDRLVSGDEKKLLEYLRNVRNALENQRANMNPDEFKKQLKQLEKWQRKVLRRIEEDPDFFLGNVAKINYADVF